jgi:hypothetical protein
MRAKTKIQSIIVIVLLWLTALALLYIVILKIKFLSHR